MENKLNEPIFKKEEFVRATNECIKTKVAKTAGRPMDRPDLPIYTFFEENIVYSIKSIGSYSDGWHVLVNGSTQYVHEKYFQNVIKNTAIIEVLLWRY